MKRAGSQARIRKNRASQPALERLAHLFRALGDPARLRVLHALGADGLSAGAIEDRTAIPRATVTRHLRALHEARAIRRIRTGAQVRYRIVDARIVDLCEQLADLLASGAAIPTYEEVAIGLFRPGTGSAPKSGKAPVRARALPRRSRAA